MEDETFVVKTLDKIIIKTISYSEYLNFTFILKEDAPKYFLEHNKHDKLFKALLGNKYQVAKLLNKYLNLKDELTSEDIENYSTEFITTDYKKREADIVYKIKNRNIFFLIEHQSTVDKLMPYRIRKYAMEIMQKVISNQIKTRNYILPKVIPLVIYTGKSKWTAPLTIEKMQEEFLTYTPYVDYALIDINRISDEDLLNDNITISKAMLIEKSKSKEEILQNIEKIARVIYSSKDESGEHLITILINYFLTGSTKEQAIKIIRKIDKGGVNDMLNCVRVIEEENKSMIKKGMLKGKIERSKEIAKNLKLKNMSIKEISEVTGLKEEDIISL